MISDKRKKLLDLVETAKPDELEIIMTLSRIAVEGTEEENQEMEALARHLEEMKRQNDYSPIRAFLAKYKKKYGFDSYFKNWRPENGR